MSAFKDYDWVYSPVSVTVDVENGAASENAQEVAPPVRLQPFVAPEDTCLDLDTALFDMA